jgi:hypothetical protein
MSGIGKGRNLVHAGASPTHTSHPGERAYLCATLPFLMSEMIRGSPRVLLAAAGKETMNLTLQDFSLR